MSVFEVILILIFPHSDWIWTRITPNMDTFHAVWCFHVIKKNHVFMIHKYVKVPRGIIHRQVVKHNARIYVVSNLFGKSKKKTSKITSTPFLETTSKKSNKYMALKTFSSWQLKTSIKISTRKSVLDKAGTNWNFIYIWFFIP